MVFSCLFLCLLTLVPAETGDSSGAFWPQWRGPHGIGVSPSANPPVRWSEDENVRWKVAVPGKGHSSPIVWGDLVFVTTSVPVPGTEEPVRVDESLPEWRRGGNTPSADIAYQLIAFDRQSGQVRWQKTARVARPHEGTHQDGSWASPSPIADSERVYAFFGSGGLYAFDFDGTPVWETDLGDMSIKMAFGEGSSPAIFDDTLVVNWDHEGQSFIVALEARTGREVWRRDRDEATSWATPLVVEQGGKAQVITSATSRIRSYALDSGQLLWEMGGMTANTIPTPVFEDGVVFATSGFRGNALLAIDLQKATRDPENVVLWRYDRDTPYVPSPLVYQGHLYFLKSNNAILSCLDAKTGGVNYGPVRVEGIDGVYASPVGAAGRVYIVGRNGTSVVLKNGPTYEVLSTNELDEKFDASPALVEGSIFLRGHGHLYCLAETAGD